MNGGNFLSCSPGRVHCYDAIGYWSGHFVRHCLTKILETVHLHSNFCSHLSRRCETASSFYLKNPDVRVRAMSTQQPDATTSSKVMWTRTGEPNYASTVSRASPHSSCQSCF